MRFPITLVVLLLPQAAAAQSADDTQIQAALQAAPEILREHATVLGWVDGRLVTLREGPGPTICEADDPAAVGYASSCYHASMADYIERGRVLRAEGRSFGEIRDIRAAEVESGVLSYPESAVVTYFLYGENGSYNPESGAVEGAFRRYVVYTPFATVESTGLADTPVVPGAPWLMDGGSYHAHIMITPTAETQN